MRYLSLIFASMLLVGCAQSTEVQTSTEDVDIQSQEQTAESEVETKVESDVDSSDETQETTESDPVEIEQEPSEELESPEPNQPQTENNQSEAVEEKEPSEPAEETAEDEAEEVIEEEVEEEVEQAQPEPTGYTLADVQENDSAASCWSVINGNVYDLTGWINSHPGGSSRILNLCGTDGSSSFNGRHGGQSNPESTLANYLLGPLS